MKKNNFYYFFSQSYRDLKKPNEKKNKSKSRKLMEFNAFLPGDKGYGKIYPPQELGVVLTSSARGENVDGARYIDKEQRDVQIFTHENIAQYRTLIERVFGRVLNAARWLLLPLPVSQKQLAYEVWIIFFCFTNMELEDNLPIFGDDYHFNLKKINKS